MKKDNEDEQEVGGRGEETRGEERKLDYWKDWKEDWKGDWNGDWKGD